MAFKVTFALAALASIALAQNQTQAGQPTLTIPFGSAPSADGFAASVQSADGCKTTLVVGCAETSSPNELCQLATDLAATLVMNPTGYQVGYSYSTLGGSAILSQSCSFEGPMTAATGGVCTLVDICRCSWLLHLGQHGRDHIQWRCGLRASSGHCGSVEFADWECCLLANERWRCRCCPYECGVECGQGFGPGCGGCWSAHLGVLKADWCGGAKQRVQTVAGSIDI